MDNLKPIKSFLTDLITPIVKSAVAEAMPEQILSKGKNLVPVQRITEIYGMSQSKIYSMFKNGELNKIKHSLLWKIAAPFRLLKKGLKKIPPIRAFFKFIWNVRHFGLKSSLRKAKRALAGRKKTRSDIYTEAELARQRDFVFEKSPCFSIVVPLYNTPNDFLVEMINSVLASTYSKWELCLADGSDVCQIEELVRLGELTKRAWAHNVQVMVEGPGHVPMDQIAANMKVQETICMGAPFYVLGPLVTDIAPGYDHITSAIGGAIAAMNGASFLCYVTPAEHLALPNVEDVKQGIIASKIAAHAADIAKGIPGARDIDDRMADARRNLDWEAQFACAMDPETARQIRDSRKPEEDHSDTCSMCGKFCAVRSMNKALGGEKIDIL